ncbi:DUF3052 family protein [Flavobacteriaceae bacterium R38]|nr:DUF3052 family protein [Flavobacteriaceae bacterium R38]
MTRTGYSGKPLYLKLGIKETHRTLLINPPDEYMDWLEIPFKVTKPSPGELADVIHIFSKEEKLLKESLTKYLPLLQQDGMIWVSWPKKASKVETDITEDTVRKNVFPLGLVDIKVCSVSEVWSGLKVVIRKENRK